jgi:hypothetical protein
LEQAQTLYEARQMTVKEIATADRRATYSQRNVLSGGSHVAASLSPFGTIGGAVCGHPIQRVVGELPALLGTKLLGAFLPGIAKGDDVVDLHGGAGVGSADEVEVVLVYVSAA